MKSEASSKKEVERWVREGEGEGEVRSWRSCHRKNFNLILKIMKSHCKA